MAGGGTLVNSFSHEDREIMNSRKHKGHEPPDLTMDPTGIVPKREFHETRVKPQQESLQPSRRMIQFVNRDPVFVMAKRTLGLFPQVAYKLVKFAGVDRARLVTAFVVSLFESEYFTVDKQGRYDPSIPGNQERARNMLMGILYGKKPIYLGYASKYFFDIYPEMRERLRQDSEATV
jgi:hypothetical protein